MLVYIGKGLIALIGLPFLFIASFWLCYKYWGPANKERPDIYGDYKGYWTTWHKNMYDLMFHEFNL